MITVKTTLNLNKQLKKMAERKALEEDTTLQEVINKALYNELVAGAVRKTKDIIFTPKAVDKNMGNLTRKDFYE